MAEEPGKYSLLSKEKDGGTLASSRGFTGLG
jgi:hypothetical protein